MMDGDATLGSLLEVPPPREGDRRPRRVPFLRDRRSRSDHDGAERGRDRRDRDRDRRV
jgi:hypothetical protein